MTKLKDDFEASGGAFKEWRIGDLFEKIQTKILKYKVKDLEGKYGEKYSLPALTAGIENQGLSCFVPRDNATILKNVISVSANGANTGVMFYQPEEFTVLQDSYAIKNINKEETSKNEYMFFVSVLQKTIRGNYTWSEKAGWERIKAEKVSVPVDSNGEINYSYMEKYISLLEEEKILKVEKFLKDSGLNDTTLTEEETTALEKFRNGEVKFEERKIGELFEKVKLGIKNSSFNKKTDLSACKDLEHPIPVINAKLGDNGIMYWAKQGDFETISKCIDVIQNGAIATGKVYAQPQETGVLWDSYLIKHVKTTIEDEQLFFFTTVIEKSIRLKFYYDCKAYWNEVKEELIMLPCTLDNSIDYTFMETYVKAIEKQCIARLKASDVFVNSRIAAKQTEPTDKVENIRILAPSSVPVADRFSRFLPLYPFHIACGALESGDALPEDDIEGWIDVSNCGFKINEQMFLVHAKGESMLPKIHPGDLCLFEKYGPMYRGGRDGNIVLVRQSNMDDDYGCQYTIKEFYSDMDPQTGRTIKVELRPLNQKFHTIKVKESDQVDVIAILKCVL